MNNQHGLTMCKSCLPIMITFHDKITEFMDEENRVDGIYLTFSIFFKSPTVFWDFKYFGPGGWATNWLVTTWKMGF